MAKLAPAVLGRDLMSVDLHAAYTHAGVSRAPKYLPANMTGGQADRIIKWLEHVQSERSKKPKDTGPDPCIYCAFGCELCEGE
jgi:hypothetical protein